jgi:hypothetical protein
LVGLQERENRFRYLVLFNTASAYLVGDVNGHVARPSFSGIEGDDADWAVKLAREQVADQLAAISGVFVRFAP